MFRAFFSPSSVTGVQLRQWFESSGYGVSARALTPYQRDMHHCRMCTPTSKDGQKESPKLVRQK
jgi:hypothetical protein